ncbi:hypothetical protein ODJ79_03690 [Actinoplanes sp. KI2]|uniref:hypothetical protein n=1 Tax=Actinoplanes sp. KI2 TaxID=2983315 RepID=UPI0021D58D27|nr:hypothetical protein [Actinoplanes sp. KI2]MCU7722807.1 hypothetical protein [Actinoplanes sp. KI2]
MPPRVYRHRPWQVGAVFLLALTAAMAFPALSQAYRNPGIDSIATAFVILVPLSAFAAFLILSRRVRTEVDDEAVTQHWITRRYRIPLAEITALEPDFALCRWFLRIHAGERTFETIPCQTLIWRPLAEALGPPRAMQAATADIESRRAAVTDQSKKRLHKPSDPVS